MQSRRVLNTIPRNSFRNKSQNDHIKENALATFTQKISFFLNNSRRSMLKALLCAQVTGTSSCWTPLTSKDHGSTRDAGRSVTSSIYVLRERVYRPEALWGPWRSYQPPHSCQVACPVVFFPVYNTPELYGWRTVIRGRYVQVWWLEGALYDCPPLYKGHIAPSHNQAYLLLFIKSIFHVGISV